MKSFEELFGDVEHPGPLRCFYDLCQVPHPTEHEEKMTAYLESLGKKLGYETWSDEVGNVTIIKPAASGYEDHPAIALQAHMDMVAEKRPGVVHDFLNDPITLVRTGDRVRADGTTLGADDGYGVATILAVLEDKNLKHPRIEAFFTVHEETDMLGASHYDMSRLECTKLINLDGIRVQVAGSGEKEIQIRHQKEMEAVRKGYESWKLVVGGLTGGHSGSNAMAERSNAIVLANRVLCALERSGVRFQICDLKGGEALSSSIPRDCQILLAVAPEDVETARTAVEQKEKEFRTENRDRDPGFFMKWTQEENVPEEALSGQCAKKLTQLLVLLPDGVYTRDHKWQGEMECCCNVGILELERDFVVVKALIRSAHLARKAFVEDKIRTAAEILDMTCTAGRDLPHWEYQISDEFLKIVTDIFQEPVRAGSSTVEMGFFAAKKPGLEQVALCGLRNNAHSPEEYFDIPDMLEAYDNLVKLLERL